MSAAEPSVFQSSLSADAKLDKARMGLLDLSARNRLLNMPRFSKTAKTIDVLDERSTEVFRLLVGEGKSLTFAPGKPDRAKNPTSSYAVAEEDIDEEADADFALPEGEDEVDDRGVLRRHTDTRLQTSMTPAGLQKRLLDLFHDARTLEEEQGVNILFLALGTLKWIDPANKENIRYAPLILVPVRLQRGTAGERFKLSARPDDMTSNLSLESYLDQIHGLRLPSCSFGDEFEPARYFEDVAAAVSTKEGWSVQPDDMVLGFFSFAKFLMYRDLDPENWPATGKLAEHAIIRGLLSDGFPQKEAMLGEDARVDAHIQPIDMLHIVDSDSSQTLAVHDVRQGRNLIIQGPPGTGKSQTIANVIASAVADGKTVLFVAEKMAALEVVKRRLDSAGVGDVCLELHSNKANKRALLDELKRTWDLGSPRGEFPAAISAKLQDARDDLNAHAHRMHEVHPRASLTPYQVIGHIVRLRQSGQGPVDVTFEGSESWSADDFERRIKLVQDLTQRIDDIGLPIHHAWSGVDLDFVLPTTAERLEARIGAASRAVDEILRTSGDLAAEFEMSPAPATIAEISSLHALADKLAQAPALSSTALTAAVWDSSLAEIRALVRIGATFEKMLSSAAAVLAPEAIDADMAGIERELGCLPDTFGATAFSTARDLVAALPQLIAQGKHLAYQLGSGDGGSIGGITRLIATAERVAAAPDASPDAFAATVWDHGLDQAEDLAREVARLENVRAAIGDQVVETAWRTDVSATRQALAVHTGVLKNINSDWRRARALARSLLKNPEMAPEQIVPLLDKLMEGQAAAAAIESGDQFGRSAFGMHWRGERSQSAPLLALVAWMRTLRGMGAEPRLIAGRLADRGPVGEAAIDLRRSLDGIRALAVELWSELGSKASVMFGETTTLDSVALVALKDRLEGILLARTACGRLLRPVPEVVSDLLKRLRYVDRLQGGARAIDDGAALGATAFGGAWHGRQSDWTALDAAVSWIEANGELRHLAARKSGRHAYPQAVSALIGIATSAERDLNVIAETLKTAPDALFGGPSAATAPLSRVARRLKAWSLSVEQLSKWVAYRARAKQAINLGLQPLVERLEDGRLTPPAAGAFFEMAYFDALLTDMAGSRPEISRFDGHLHAQRVREFANLDRERIKAACLEVVRAHHRRIPPRDGSVGPLGVLRGEMARRRNHMSIRLLMQRAGSAVQALKPVMMMSPLSVAQFLTPGQISFDLLVMDEASQIQPVDALGAIARARQVVVVGDERQLPPTSFFAKITGSQDEGEEEGAQVADMESILGLFSARGLPERMLRWHYRSRHQSLIAVSNSQFYENKLFIVPSPYTVEAGMGLRFHHVPGGVFEQGANKIEAQTIAAEVIRHAKTYPGQSLGVVAFSITQRRAIQDELELLRRANPDTEAFFHAHGNEPFFVKNLENVQGDERDVIMISVGYAKNAQGHMLMRFGPLGSEGGERRLNVLISRAKRRCEVFASITDEDIDTERAKGKGVFAFKLFLHYARTGRLSMSSASSREMDSLFEEQVANALQERGYQVHPQVGIAGFFIDLAIADSNRPGRYLLGVECDGAAYHSARSARDRDRLRQSVLEDHGWIIHRIWSYDWFQRPREELDRVINAIEEAKLELDARADLQLQSHRAVPVEISTVDRGDVVEVGLADAEGESSQALSIIYVEATPERSGDNELHETPLGVMAHLIAQIVEVETPVHVDEVVVRLRDAWGLQRAGARIQAAVARGVDVAVDRGFIVNDGAFLSAPGIKPRLRNRANVMSATLRRPDMLPPSEVAGGILEIVEANLGATEGEIVGMVARGLGYKATSSQLREVLSKSISDLLATGQLLRQNDLIVVVPPVVSPSSSASTEAELAER